MIHNRLVGAKAVFGLFAALLPLNCGDKATTTVTIGPVDVATWATAMAQAVCARADRCYGIAGSGIDAHQVVRGMPCLDYFTAFFGESYSPTEAISAGRLVWEADALGTCLENYVASRCDSEEHLDLSWQWPCLKLTAAVKATGTCSTDFECVDGTYCDPSNGCPGTCQPEGTSCTADYMCASNEFCDTSYDWDNGETVNRCDKTTREGEYCGDPDLDMNSCEKGLECTLEEGGDFTGYCAQPVLTVVGSGRLCVEASDSTARYCEDGLVCTSVPKDADPTVFVRHCSPVVELGGACLRDDSVSGSVCTDGTFCDAAADLTTGKCATRSTVGADCVPSNPRSCVLGATCDETTSQCRAITFGTVGDPCETDADCFGYCNIQAGVGTCALRPC